MTRGQHRLAILNIYRVYKPALLGHLPPLYQRSVLDYTIGREEEVYWLVDITCYDIKTTFCYRLLYQSRSATARQLPDGVLYEAVC